MMQKIVLFSLFCALLLSGCTDDALGPMRDNSIGKMITLNEAVGFWGHPRTADILMHYVKWNNDPPENDPPEKKVSRQDYMQQLVQKVQVEVNGQVALAQRMKDWEIKVDLRDHIEKILSGNKCFDAEQIQKSVYSAFSDWKEWKFKNHKLPPQQKPKPQEQNNEQTNGEEEVVKEASPQDEEQSTTVEKAEE